jgi:hypothetical protein
LRPVAHGKEEVDSSSPFGRRTDTAPERGAESALTMEMLGEALAERLGKLRDSR